jgi:hypothetical protein
VPAAKPESKSDTNSTSANFLNEPQHRHFEVFLSMLENALNEIEGLSRPSTGQRVDRLSIYDFDLPADFAVSARPLFESIRAEMNSLADSLGIAQRHHSTKRTVSALLTAELVRLDDSYTRKLRGYGPVKPEATTVIDPILDEIRTALTGLLAALDSSGKNNVQGARH